MVHPGDILNGVALLVALVALVVSLSNMRTADRAARNDVLAQVRSWGDAVVDMLSDAAALCALDATVVASGDFFVHRSQLMSRASSLLDRGRFFFPNADGGAVSTLSGGGAFKGVRPQILDLLLLAHGLTRSIDSKTGAGNDRRECAFVHLKRAFVSAIQISTSFSSPATVKKYEEYLTTVPVEPLPEEIRELAGATEHGLELTFLPELRLNPRFRA